MKIIHGHDYYDSANYGIDPDIIFVRDEEVPKSLLDRNGALVDLPFNDQPVIVNTRWQDSVISKKHHFRHGFVFCAGDVFPVIRHTYVRSSVTMIDENINYYYDYDSAKAVYDKADYPEGFSWFDQGNTNLTRLHDHFAQRNPKWSEWLIKNGIVTGYYLPAMPQYNETLFNFNGPSLGEFQFYKIKDSFTANQDIAGYVGGVLPANENPMIELDDVHKIQKAGFDKVTSFRKSKTKRK